MRIACALAALAVVGAPLCSSAGAAAQVIVRRPSPVTVAITSPTSGATHDAGSADSVVVAGTGASALAVTGCTWANSLGGSGSAAPSGSGQPLQWSFTAPLTIGSNAITVTCANAGGTVSTATVTVTRSAESACGVTVTCHYIRDGGTASTSGTGSCTGWATANACDTFPVTLQRGHVYYVAAGTYGAYTFDDAESGATLVTIRKATVSDHGSNADWLAAYGDQAVFTGTFSVHSGKLTWDGATRNESDWADCNAYGFKIDTSAHHGKGIATSNSFDGAADAVEVAYTCIIGGGPDGNDFANDLIYAPFQGPNWHIHHNFLYDSGRVHIYLGDSNNTIEHNYFWITESVASGPEEQHAESIQTLGSVETNNLVFRYNIWREIQGTGLIVLNNVDGFDIHGNVFFDNPNYGNGLIAATTGSFARDGRIHGNTFVDNVAQHIFQAGTGSVSSVTAKNNLFCGGDATVAFHSGVTHDYNAAGSDLGEVNDQLLGSCASVFAGYAADDFRLFGPTSAGDTSIGAAYGTDLDGNTRGADGTWDRGAFEFESGGGAFAGWRPATPSRAPSNTGGQR